jgi:hypothetical protein
MSSFISLKAQTPLTPGAINYPAGGSIMQYPSFNDSNPVNKKWTLQKYAGLSASYGFYNGGSSSGISVPVGLQLHRRLNNNLYAFAGISAAPVFYNFNRSFIHSDISKYRPVTSMYGNHGVSLYSRFEAGLMYVNDDRTFSISGSIGIERSSYPPYPYYNTPYLQKQQQVTGSRQ